MSRPPCCLPCGGAAGFAPGTPAFPTALGSLLGCSGCQRVPRREARVRAVCQPSARRARCSSCFAEQCPLTPCKPCRGGDREHSGRLPKWNRTRGNNAFCIEPRNPKFSLPTCKPHESREDILHSVLCRLPGVRGAPSLACTPRGLCSSQADGRPGCDSAQDHVSSALWSVTCHPIPTSAHTGRRCACRPGLGRSCWLLLRCARGLVCAVTGRWMDGWTDA